MDASSHVTSAVCTLIAAAHDTLSAFAASAKRRQRVADKNLAMVWEEFDFVIKMLTSFIQQCAAGDSAIAFTEDTLDAVERLLKALTGFSTVSTVVDPASSVKAAYSLNETSCINIGVDPTRSRALHPPWLTRGARNAVRVTLLDSSGQPVYGVTPSDILLSFESEIGGWIIASVTVVECNVDVGLMLFPDCSAAETLRVSVPGSSKLIELKVCILHYSCSRFWIAFRTLLLDEPVMCLCRRLHRRIRLRLRCRSVSVRRR